MPDPTELAAARLVSVSAQPYLAAVLFALSPVPVEGLGTFGVDRHFRLYYDPACFTKWTIEECAAVLVHEAMHVLRDHGGRATDLGVTVDQAHRWNVASDLEINDDLEHLPLPAGGVHPRQFHLQTGDMAEVYFAALNSVAVPASWCQGGSGVDGRDAAWEKGADPTVPRVNPDEGDLIRQQVAMEIRQQVNAGASVPGGMARWADAFLQPKIDWRRRLAGAIRGSLGVVSGAVDYRYGRPSRRTGTPLGRRVVFPRLVQPVPRVAVVVDTSASMDAEILSRVMAELRGILRSAGISRQSTLVISCDTEVRAKQEVVAVSGAGLVGGGGTDLGAGMRAAAEARPECQVIVVLTDGFTPWPEQAPGRSRYVIGVISALRGREPDWAEVIEIPE